MISCVAEAVLTTFISTLVLFTLQFVSDSMPGAAVSVLTAFISNLVLLV